MQEFNIWHEFMDVTVVYTPRYCLNCVNAIVCNFSQIDMLDWFNLLEVNISLAKLLRVPNLQVRFTH